jgi:hypothetical protein
MTLDLPYSAWRVQDDVLSYCQASATISAALALPDAWPGWHDDDDG